MTDRRKRFLIRGGLVAGLVVLLVGAMLTPSLGGSFLTSKKAKKTFVNKSGTVTTKVASSTTLPGFNTTSTTPLDIPGAAVNLTVPKQQKKAILLVTFSGVSLCRNVTFGFQCELKVLVDGAPADPAPDPNGYIWDTTEPSASAPNKSLSLTVSKSVGPGNHTVKVSYNGGVAGTTFILRTWHLSAQATAG